MDMIYNIKTIEIMIKKKELINLTVDLVNYQYMKNYTN